MVVDLIFVMILIMLSIEKDIELAKTLLLQVFNHKKGIVNY